MPTADPEVYSIRLSRDELTFPPRADEPFWTTHDDRVFLWEKSGWPASICHSPVRGRTARALTVGKFEPTHVVFIQDRKLLGYSSHSG